jgi:hypothetical protein
MPPLAFVVLLFLGIFSFFAADFDVASALGLVHGYDRISGGGVL